MGKHIVGIGNLDPVGGAFDRAVAEQFHMLPGLQKGPKTKELHEAKRAAGP